MPIWLLCYGTRLSGCACGETPCWTIRRRGPGAVCSSARRKRKKATRFFPGRHPGSSAQAGENLRELHPTLHYRRRTTRRSTNCWEMDHDEITRPLRRQGQFLFVSFGCPTENVIACMRSLGGPVSAGSAPPLIFRRGNVKRRARGDAGVGAEWIYRSRRSRDRLFPAFPSLISGSSAETLCAIWHCKFSPDNASVRNSARCRARNPGNGSAPRTPDLAAVRDDVLLVDSVLAVAAIASEIDKVKFIDQHRRGPAHPVAKKKPRHDRNWFCWPQCDGATRRPYAVAEFFRSAPDFAPAGTHRRRARGNNARSGCALRAALIPSSWGGRQITAAHAIKVWKHHRDP